MAAGGSLDGQVAFVTGAARGHGRAQAVRLAAEEANVIAIDLCGRASETITYASSTPDELADTARAIKATGRDVLTREVDIRDLAALQQVVADGVAQFGRLDILVAKRRRPELEPTVGDVRGTMGHRHRRQPQRHMAQRCRR